MSPGITDPAVAYEEAVHPFEVIRNASQNWSDVERSAYTAARARAKEACASMDAAAFSVDQLIAKARLCALGDSWEAVLRSSDAALSRLQDESRVGHDDLIRQLGFALAWKVQADLRLQRPDDALAAARTMLRKVPYDAKVAEAVNSVVGYLRFSEPDKALALAEERQPQLLAALYEPATGDPAHASGLTAAILYADALSLPSMLQYLNQPAAAKALFDEVEASLPSTLSPGETHAIARRREAYRLLGKPLPPIEVSAYLMDPEGRAKRPRLEATGATTVFLAFPDWCIQCIALRPQIEDTWKRLGAESIRFFPLLAQEDPAAPGALKNASRTVDEKMHLGSRPHPATGEKGELPRLAVQIQGDNRPFMLLKGTPTFLVSASTLKSFFATEIPLIIVADRNGFIRVLQVSGENYLAPGGALEQMARHVDQTWR